MRKGFTKIPNSLLDMPLSMDALALYTWLSLQADKNGLVRASRSLICEHTGFSERQVRTTIEKLVASKLLTKLPTKLPTKFATTLTITFLSSCADGKTKSDQVNDQVSDQVNDQVNEVAQELPEVTIISHTKSACEAFCEWLKKECPYIASHYKLMSEAEFEKLKAEYDSQAIAEQCLNIENRVDLRKKYSNLYRTLLNWLKRNSNATTRTNQRQQESPTNDELRQQTVEFLANREAQRRTREGEIW